MNSSRGKEIKHYLTPFSLINLNPKWYNLKMSNNPIFKKGTIS